VTMNLVLRLLPSVVVPFVVAWIDLSAHPDNTWWTYAAIAVAAVWAVYVVADHVKR